MYKLRCVSNFYMENDNELAFKVDEFYEFESVGEDYYCCEFDATGMEHFMTLADLLDNFTFISK